MERVLLVGGEHGVGLEELVMGVERVGHHLGAKGHQGDLLLESGTRDPELHDGIPFATDSLSEIRPALVIDP